MARTAMSRRRLTPAELGGEIAASLLNRPGRLALTAMGTVLGIGALLATLGLAATAGNHIVTRFDELAATEVVIEPVRSDDPLKAGANVLSWTAQGRLEHLNGVRAAGAMAEIDIAERRVRAVRLHDPAAPAPPRVQVVAATPGLLRAVRGELATGRWFDRGHSDRAARVAVIGATVAERFGVADLGRRAAVFVGDEAFTVIGVLARTAREPALTGAIVIPSGTARALFSVQRPTKVYADTEIGAARLIARQAPPALYPRDPRLLRAAVPPEPVLVRAQVTGDVRAMLLLLGGLALIVGGFGIANTTLVSVMERRAEIALRRSMGAQRKQIATQFLVESAAIGVVGGVIGASFGVLVTVGVAAAKGWTPVLAPWLPFAGVGFGALIGLVAGAYPAIRAARLEPIEVLRGEG